MKQVLRLLVIAALISVILLGGYYTFWVVPEKVENAFITTLKNTGFENVEYQSSSRHNGKIIFNNITLDKDSFSKMKKAELHYTLFGFVFGNEADRIILDGLRLTGALDKDWNFEISGQKNASYFLAAIHRVPVQTIELKNSSIDVLSTLHGGIKLDYNAILRRQNGKIDLSAAIVSAQQQLLAKGKANGTLFPDGKTDIKLDIQELQIDRDTYKISRANAKGSLTIIPGSATYISLETSAGAARFYDIPTKNLTIKYSQSGKDYTIDTTGKTIGKQELDFTTALQDKNGDNTFSGEVKAAKALDLTEFLIDNDIIPEKHNLPDLILTTSQAVLTFNMASILNENIYNGSFNYETKEPEFQVGGRFELDPAKTKVTGTFAMPETKKNIKSLKNDNISAQITLSSVGAFKLENWKSPNRKFSWSFELHPQSGEINYGLLKLQDIQGSIAFDSNQKIQNKQYLKYSLPLKNSIRHNGVITVNFGESSDHALERIILNIYEGTIKTSKLQIKNNIMPEEMIIHLSDINLSSFLKDTGIKGLEIIGQIGGKLPVEIKGNKILVRNGLLQSQSSGLVSISKDLRDGLFPGRAKNMQVIRESLDNYFYEFFEVRLDGDLAGTVMMTVNARGLNPDMPDKTPVDLSLQIETEVSDLFSGMVKK